MLVVDDLPANRAIIIESPGVDDPLMAVDLLRGAAAGGRPYTCVLLDHQMPVMTGLETARVTQADPALAVTRLETCFGATLAALHTLRPAPTH